METRAYIVTWQLDKAADMYDGTLSVSMVVNDKATLVEAVALPRPLTRQDIIDLVVYIVAEHIAPAEEDPETHVALQDLFQDTVEAFDLDDEEAPYGALLVMGEEVPGQEHASPQDILMASLRHAGLAGLIGKIS